MEYSKEFLELLNSVTDKRPKTVIQHILQKGFITTEELKNDYGYNHPPRAVRDVRERGIPIITYRVEGSDGRKIAAYKFGEYDSNTINKKDGRTALPQKLRKKLIENHGEKCNIYNEYLPGAQLQIDHRIPYEVGGDPEGEINTEDFQLLSPSANRAKDWTCEHCNNWNNQKDKNICKTCYWAYPENYTHVAMEQIRRLDIEWKNEDVPLYTALAEHARYLNKDVQQIVKEVITNYLQQNHKI